MKKFNPLKTPSHKAQIAVLVVILLLGVVLVLATVFGWEM